MRSLCRHRGIRTINSNLGKEGLKGGIIASNSGPQTNLSHGTATNAATVSPIALEMEKMSILLVKWLAPEEEERLKWMVS